MLSPRTERVLKSIVEQYTTRAVPVASQTIYHDNNPGISPATIRNEMAHLEEEGYITRRHPSAGSIPSDKGYRYYVESLTDIRLPIPEQCLISHLFHQVEAELAEWLSLAATVIAKLAQNLAIVTMPKPVDRQFKHLELVALQDSLALAILILRGARVSQQLITFDQAISQPGLTAIANKLNEAYSGLSSQQILAKDVGLSAAEQQVTDCLLKLMEAEGETGYEESCLDGLHFMLGQPEFAHSQRMLALMELAEHRNLLKIITPQCLPSRGVRVIIGKENKAEVIQDYSVVIGRYGLPEEALGTIGVVGPTRMPYAHTISVVSYLSTVLSRLMVKLYGRETPAELELNIAKSKE